jgi:hypothetical protein
MAISSMTLSMPVLSVIFCYAEFHDYSNVCRYAECRYAGYHYAECDGAKLCLNARMDLIRSNGRKIVCICFVINWIRLQRNFWLSLIGFNKSQMLTILTSWTLEFVADINQAGKKNFYRINNFNKRSARRRCYKTFLPLFTPFRSKLERFPCKAFSAYSICGKDRSMQEQSNFMYLINYIFA